MRASGGNRPTGIGPYAANGPLFSDNTYRITVRRRSGHGDH